MSLLDIQAILMIISSLVLTFFNIWNIVQIIHDYKEDSNLSNPDETQNTMERKLKQ